MKTLRFLICTQHDIIGWRRGAGKLVFAASAGGQAVSLAEAECAYILFSLLTGREIVKFVKWFEEVGREDVALVGGKNASLGEMIGSLGAKGVNVPSGFAVTAEAYKYVVEKAGIAQKIEDALTGLDTHDMENLSKRGEEVRSLIGSVSCPEELEEEIRTAYREMEKKYGRGVDVAVRSSATAEDLPTASFAGQQETYLNVRGEEALVGKVMECFASLFTNRAISYRVDKGFDHLSVYLSVGVQKMVRSDLASSGVIFSIDTESGFKDAVYITGAYGLGENVVQGIVNPDQFYVFKPTLKEGFRPIVEKKVGTKAEKLVYKESGAGTEQKEVEAEERRRLVLSDDEVILLAKWACIIEEHYGTPMDIVGEGWNKRRAFRSSSQAGDSAFTGGLSPAQDLRA